MIRYSINVKKMLLFLISLLTILKRYIISLVSYIKVLNINKIAEIFNGRKINITPKPIKI